MTLSEAESLARRFWRMMGNRRQQVFFSDADYQAYLELMAEWCGREGVRILAWCLMPNHVHLVAVPSSPESLARAVGEAHRRYTRLVSFREGWGGYLWQGRFGSFVMDRKHCLAAVRYIERNPVRAGLVSKAWKWPWSSAAAHVEGRGDALVRAGGAVDWRRFLSEEEGEAELALLRRHSRTGRPLGRSRFVRCLEERLGRCLSPGRPGPKPRRKHKGE